MAWELQEAITYYKKQGAPKDQNALTGLLREVQSEFGGIPERLAKEIAREYGVKESYILALIRRYPSLRLREIHTLELCAGPNCGKHLSLAKFAESLASPNLTVRFLPCQRMCGKGPNIRFDGRLYNRADEALLKELTKDLT